MPRFPFNVAMEKIMQYIWQYRLWNISDMAHTVDGSRLSIIDTGQLNSDAGPDFFNAKVRIDDETWVGNVEIHVRASDWYRHHHDSDPAYDTVILHVVEKDDIAIRRRDGSVIPQVVMPFAYDFARRYDEFVNNPASQLSCAPFLADIPSLHVTSWIEALAYERINAKCERVLDILDRSAGNWEQACFIILARSLGFGVNNDAFESVARSLPLSFLGKHSDSLLSLEALIFGQAGLLDIDSDHIPYLEQLKKEYAFLANKFQLHPPEKQIKMARMRPQNFPHRRLSLLAHLCYGGFRMMARISSAQSVDEARTIFDINLTGFWTNHYTFTSTADSDMRVLARRTVDSILINTVVPLAVTFFRYNGDTLAAERAMSMLDEIRPESNTIVDLFLKAGLKCRDAFTSQALIQLRREYCEKRKCLYCRFGHRMLAQRAMTSDSDNR